MASSKTELGFGIVGCGMVADFHVQAIRHATGARLVGVAARSAEKAKAFAEKHGIGFHTQEVAALVQRPDVDIVCITTPSGAHLEPSVIAARAGKHLVVEKPLEITVERVDELLRVGKENGIVIAPVYPARFGAGARRLKAAIDAGRFGRLVLCSAYVKWHRKPAYYENTWKGTSALDGGGALMNQGIHAIDLLQWFAGMPSEVFAWTDRRVHTGIEVEDTACATLRFATGALGVIEASTAVYPGWQRRIEICGEKGSVIIEDDRLTRWDFQEPLADDATVLSTADDSMRSGAGSPNAISYQGHLRQIQDLIDGLHEKRPLAVDAAESRNAVALIRALYASAEKRGPVRI